MKGYLPGTALETDWSGPDPLAILDAIFAAGGLVLSQVSRLTGLEPHTVQNWVKRGFCSSPVAKQYSSRQFCRLIIINLLKDSLSIPQITGLLSYINNSLADESDDAIDDDRLYRYFVTILMKLDHAATSEERLREIISKVTGDYQEPFPGAAKRLQRVLQIMITAYFATRLKNKAETLLLNLD